MKNDLNNKKTVISVDELPAEEPGFYQVVLHNDEFTPMEFVMKMLEKIFFMTRVRAAEVMLEAHQQGIAACGAYTKEVAESRLEEVEKLARANGYPLLCSMEAA